MEQLAEAGPEFAVEAGATDLKQEIGATAGPSHLLLFVHAVVDQEVGGAFHGAVANSIILSMAGVRRSAVCAMACQTVRRHEHEQTAFGQFVQNNCPPQPSA